MEKIMITKITKIKTKNMENEKLLVEFIKPITNGTGKKGYNSFTQWLSDITIYDKLENNDFGKIIEANLGITEPDFQGKVNIKINDIIINGKRIEFK